MRFADYRRPGLLVLAVCSSLTALAAPAAAQTAPAPAAPEAPVIRPYAWIKPTVIFTASPVESFSQPNSTAGTAAANPVLAPFGGDEAGWTFQVGQSRLGFWFNDKGAVRGQFEFDFLDFTKSSPTTGAVPRLRIAKIEWNFSDSLQLQAGQDWDLFQPVNPLSFDIVSVAYQAGNTAFMRQQVKLIYLTPSLEVGGAVGLASSSNATRALLPDYNPYPTIAARAALRLGEKGAGRLGISAIATSWRFAPDAPNERRALAAGLGAYGDMTFAGMNLRFEAYYGQNLANLGTLSLGQGNATDDIKEIGATASLKLPLSEVHALYVLGGTARILNDEDVVPSYSYPAVDGGGVPAESTATLAGTGPGMVWNHTARLGYEYRYDKNLAFVIEGFMFHSKHVLNQQFDADLDDVQTAFGSEVGLSFTL